jgi:hypothetical protein
MMDMDIKLEIAVAKTDAMAVGSIAIAGVVAICNELAFGGVLDGEQLTRIQAFMTQATERGPGTERLQSHVQSLIAQHFEHLHNRMVENGGKAVN